MEMVVPDISKITLKPDDILVVTIDEDLLSIRNKRGETGGSDELLEWIRSIKELIREKYPKNHIILVTNKIKFSKIEKYDTYDNTLNHDWEIK